jgi:hypothetical protein
MASDTPCRSSMSAWRTQPTRRRPNSSPHTGYGPAPTYRHAALAAGHNRLHPRIGNRLRFYRSFYRVSTDDPGRRLR